MIGVRGGIDMGYRELIKKVQHYSGFSDKESQEALDCTVGTLAAMLTEGERKDFASQLPMELQDVAMAAEPIEDKSEKDLLHQIVERQHIDEGRAKKQLMASWQALKDAISKGEIEDIKAQLPNRSAAMLY
jgi:uncharacterized protein (DUF2267 family)